MDIKLSKGARKAIHTGEYFEREKLPGEVEAPTNDLFKRGTYKVGDGDPCGYVPRPGSLVAFTLPSRGLV